MPGEVRLVGVARRDQLQDQFPEAGLELVWTVAEFDLAGASVISNLIDAGLEKTEEAIARELTDRYRERAPEIYDLQWETALREVAWDQWFELTDDFVVYTWCGGYGSRLRASLERGARPWRSEPVDRPGMDAPVIGRRHARRQPLMLARGQQRAWTHTGSTAAASTAAVAVSAEWWFDNRPRWGSSGGASSDHQSISR